VEAPQPLVSVPLGRSNDVLAGEPILVGGNPGGRGIVFSSGIVSVLHLLKLELSVSEVSINPWRTIR